jgi:tetratricopeptide (TPR) repeat protein
MEASWPREAQVAADSDGGIVATEFRDVNEMSLACEGAWTLLNTGASREARVAFQQFWSSNPIGVKALRGVGQRAMAEGDVALAEAVWCTMEELIPGDPWVNHGLGVCMLRRLQFSEAEQFFRDMSRALPDFAPAWRGLAQALGGRGDHAGSLAAFEQAAEVEPDELRSRRDCVVAAARAHSWEEAASHLEQLRASGATEDVFAEAEGMLARLKEESGRSLGEARSARDSGIAAARAGRFVEAVDRLEPLRDAFAGDDEFWLSLGEARRALKDPAAARECFERALALDERLDDLWLHADLGHCLVETRDFAGAESVFRGVLARDENFFHALRGVALVARGRGDRDGEKLFFTKAAAANPNDSWMKWELANIAAAEGDVEGAWQGFEAVLSVETGFVQAYRSLIALALQRGDAAAARRIVDRAKENLPEDPWVAFDAARVLVKEKRAGEAEKAFSGLADVSGPCAEAAALERYYLLRGLGQDVRAREALDAALAARPEARSFLVAKAGDCLARRELDEAESYYRKADMKSGDRYWTLIGIANVALARGNDRKAAHLYHAAIDVAPFRPQAFDELIELSSGDEHRARAVGRLRDWAKSRPCEIEPHRLLARFAAAAGDLDEALLVGEDMLARWPDDVTAMLLMGEIVMRRGEGARAASLFDHALQVAPDDPAALEMAARRAEWRDEPDAALGFYAQALEKDPARHWLALAKVTSLFALGRREDGLAELEAFRASRGETAEYFFTLVEMKRNIGDLAGALQATRAGRKAFPRHARIQVQGALIEAELGNFDAALVGMADWSASGRRERAGKVFAAGMCALGQWRLEDATDLIAKAHEIDPEDSWRLDRLIHSELITFELAGAEQHLRELARLNRGRNRIKGVSVCPSQTHYGQLFDEFRLDRDGCVRTKAALALEGGLGIEALRQVVREFHDYTPAAIALLIALRRKGGLNHSLGSRPARIPLRVTQFWDDETLPADLDLYVDSWRAKNPKFEHKRLNEGEARDFLDGIGRADALRGFDKAEEPAMKADIFRLGWLFQHGGFYADCDDRCQTDLAELLLAGDDLVLYQEDIGSIGNNFLACAPGHPVIGAAFEEAVASINKAKPEILWLATGPGLLTRAFGRWLAEGDLREKLSSVRVLDRHEALMFAAIHCGSAYKFTERHWSRTAFGGRR